MSAGCHAHEHSLQAPGADPRDAAFRRVLWLALAVNGAMFGIELGFGLKAGSSALLADAVDFLGDAANYAIALFVLNLSLRWRAGSALLKGLAMVAFGLGVAAATVHAAVTGGLPHATTMGAVGALALAANLGVALLLFRHRKGDANRRAVWLCTRNDAIGNVAVLLAAAGMFASTTPWPDRAVAAIMAGLALHSGVQVVRLSWRELARARARQAPAHGHP
jgi:cation diffusion facilitator family transporter